MEIHWHNSYVTGWFSVTSKHFENLKAQFLNKDLQARLISQDEIQPKNYIYMLRPNKNVNLDKHRKKSRI